MKKYAHFFVAVGITFSYSCFAQNDAKNVTNLSSKNDLAVVSYHVEERINMSFGGSVRTYEVTDLDLITPKDLGKNNVRIITPKYAKVKAKAVEIKGDEKPIVSSSPTIASTPVNINLLKKPIVEEKKKDFVTIDVVKTYERIMDKGYQSVPMITKVADRNFFEGDMETAAKWYAELFKLTTDLEPVYYFRYGKSLISIGKTDEGNELIKIFKSKNL